MMATQTGSVPLCKKRAVDTMLIKVYHQHNLIHLALEQARMNKGESTESLLDAIGRLNDDMHSLCNELEEV